jgi:hypothetical protein
MNFYFEFSILTCQVLITCILHYYSWKMFEFKPCVALTKQIRGYKINYISNLEEDDGQIN